MKTYKISELKGVVRVGDELSCSDGVNGKVVFTSAEGAIIQGGKDIVQTLLPYYHPKNSGTANIDITIIKKAPVTWQNMKVGDIVKKEDYYNRTILEVGNTGEVFLTSDSESDHIPSASWDNVKVARKMNWKISAPNDEADDVEELSVAEVAKKLDIDPDKLKIIDK